jgi:ABC-type glycerol-3-phosphate transport system permease component
LDRAVAGTDATPPGAARGLRILPLWQRRLARSLFAAVVWVILLVGAIVVLIPILWVISTSLKEWSQVFVYPPQWIPRPIRWRNYIDAWTTQPFSLYLRNTLITTLIPVFGSVLSSSLVAFSFSRLRWRARDILFFICLSTMMLPGQVTMIPVFIIYKRLGWVDTFLPFTVPSFFGGGAFNIFLLRQFFMTIDYGLEEAAEIDGAGPFQIWWRIIMPLSKPAVTVIAIFGFMGHWQDFMGPVIYLHREKMWTLIVGLTRFSMPTIGRPTLQFQMAATFIVTLPPLILFFFLQRYFIGGVVFTGMKE